MASQDTEITLGTGKMLVLFFSLVALCGLFFGLGFSLGRGSVRPLTSTEQAQAAAGLRNSTLKSNGSSPSTDTSSKTAEQKDASPQASEPAPKPASNAAQNNPPDPLTATAGYFVQVAAVSKQDDAQALVEALKKKQYAAFASNTSAGDKFFHVQVGPFGDLKEAEATRAKLIGDGYNPILKK